MNAFRVIERIERMNIFDGQNTESVKFVFCLLIRSGLWSLITTWVSADVSMCSWGVRVLEQTAKIAINATETTAVTTAITTIHIIWVGLDIEGRPAMQENHKSLKS